MWKDKTRVKSSDARLQSRLPISRTSSSTFHKDVWIKFNETIRHRSLFRPTVLVTFVDTLASKHSVLILNTCIFWNKWSCVYNRFFYWTIFTGRNFKRICKIDTDTKYNPSTKDIWSDEIKRGGIEMSWPVWLWEWYGESSKINWTLPEFFIRMRPF